MGIVYIGSLETTGKRVISYDKNDIVLKDAFVGHEHPTIKCKEETILLTLERSIWKEINQVTKNNIELR